MFTMKLTKYLRTKSDRDKCEAHRRGRRARRKRTRRHVGCEWRRGGCPRAASWPSVTRREFLDIRSSPRNLIPA